MTIQNGNISEEVFVPNLMSEGWAWR